MTVAAILLAAGSSRRFGTENKLLAEVDGIAIVRHVANALERSAAGEIVVVVGADRKRIAAALDGARCRLVVNTRHDEGIGSSIMAGIQALSPEVAGALIVPGDLPFLTPAVIDALIRTFDAAGGTRIVYAATESGEQRNPVLWPRRFFPDLSSLPGERGGKSILERHRAEADALPIGDLRLLQDVDTPDDLVALPAAKP